MLLVAGSPLVSARRVAAQPNSESRSAINQAARSPDRVLVAAPSASREMPPKQVTIQSVLDAGDPLECTPQMREWATSIVRGATNDVQKAKALFEAVRKVATPGPVVGDRYRTAAGVFAELGTTNNSFLCQELAYLYVALARATDLDAQCVFVEQDCYGNQDFHTCVAVAFPERTNLVDPVYATFDAPHQRFRILNDSETLAVHLSGMPGLAASQLARKLAPNLVIVRTSLFDKLAQDQNWKEAEVEKEALVQLSPDSPSAHYAEAVTALRQGRLHESCGPALLALQQAPTSSRLYALAAEIFMRQGELDKAESSAHNAVKFSQNRQAEEWARSYLAFIIARQRVAAGDWSGAVSNYSAAITLKPDYAEMYSARGNARLQMGELENALQDFTRAIALASNLAGAYDGRGYVRYTRGDVRGAVEDYDKAVQFQPSWAETYLRRGAAKERIGDTSGASADYKMAMKLDPSLQDAAERLALLDQERIHHRNSALAISALVAGALIIGIWTWRRSSEQPDRAVA